jgi:acyl-CoA thioesterase-1
MKSATHSSNILLTILFVFGLQLSVLITGCDRQEEVPTVNKASKENYTGTIITVGNSLTAGLGVAETEAWPALLEKKLQENDYSWQVINAGISGETSSGALTRIKWILAQQPEIIIFETGANDGLRGIPVPVIEKNISKAVQVMLENNVTVILAGMQIVRNLGADYTKDFADIYPTIARKQDVFLIPFFLQQVAGEPSLNQADSIHPNKKGHIIIADTVYPYVLQAIHKTSL